MKRAIFLSAIAITMLTACNNDENGTNGNDNRQATFFATIDGQRATRAYDTSWNADDAIGISGGSYANVKYQTTGDGNFTATDTEIYYQDDQPVIFIAYYPWNDLPAAGTISADTWKQAEQKSFDFLWAQATGSKASPNVAFTFSHRMAKVVLTIRKGADVSYEDVKAALLTLGGFKNEGTFDAANGNATATQAGNGTWTFAGNTTETSYNAPYVEGHMELSLIYTLILFPQSFDATLPFSAELTGRQTFSATLDFTTANRNAGDTTPKNEWVAGRQYNLSVTLHKTALTVDGCTIAPWNEAEGGNVDAD